MCEQNQRHVQFSFILWSSAQQKHVLNIQTISVKRKHLPQHHHHHHHYLLHLHCVNPGSCFETNCKRVSASRQRHWLSQTRLCAGLQGNQSALNNSPKPEMRSRERLALNEPLLAPCQSLTEWKDGRERKGKAAGSSKLRRNDRVKGIWIVFHTSNVVLLKTLLEISILASVPF